METLISFLRSILGTPDFGTSEAINYAAISEYFIAALFLLIVVSFIFKIVLAMVKR